MFVFHAEAWVDRASARLTVPLDWNVVLVGLKKSIVEFLARQLLTEEQRPDVDERTNSH